MRQCLPHTCLKTARRISPTVATWRQNSLSGFVLQRTSSGESRPGIKAFAFHHMSKRIARAMWAQYLPTTDTLKAVATTVGEKFGRGSTQALLYFHRYFEASYIGFALRRLKQSPHRVVTPHELRRHQKLSRLHKKREGRQGSCPPEDAATVTRTADGTISVEMLPPHERYLRRKSLPKKRIIGQRKKRKPQPKVRSF